MRADVMGYLRAQGAVQEGMNSQTQLDKVAFLPPRIRDQHFDADLHMQYRQLA